MEENSGARVLSLNLAIVISSLFYFLTRKSRIEADFDEDVKRKASKPKLLRRAFSSPH
jgi:hypothetical protein